jgi:O-antigen ligase
MLFLVVNDLVALPGNLLSLGREDQVDEDSANFSNRVPLWIECLRYLKRKPIAGYGYGAFWTPERVVAVSTLPQMAWSTREQPENLYLETAHNQYLESALGTGVIGLSLFTMTIFGAIGIYAQRAFHEPFEPWFYGFSVLIWLAITMMFERVSFQPFMWDIILPIVLCKACLKAESEVAPAGSREVGIENPEVSYV